MYVYTQTHIKNVFSQTKLLIILSNNSKFM